MELTREMIEEILDKARSYVMSEKEEYFRSQVEQMISSEDYDSLYDAFYTSLAFGTAGMRGVIGGGTNRINTFMVRKVTQGLADYCNSYSDSPSVVIAYDSRNWSKEFALSAALVLSANGVRTYLYDTLHPVPMLSFALRHLGTTAGIVITASHNPSKYNGYKVYWSDGGQVTPPHDIEIAKLANAVSASDIKDIDEAEARKSGILSGVPDSVDEAYYSMVISSLRRPQVVKGSPITVAYTPLHGSGNVPVREMLSRLGIRTEVVKEQELPDGNFPTVRLPNPESAEAMTKVIELAKAVKADIVLGTDPDADRMGLAIPTDSGKTDYLLLTGNQIASLLADYLLCTNREQGGRDRKPLVVKSLVTTDLVRKIAKENGADCKDVLTGFKYIAREMNAIDQGKNKDNFFLFGCEESYGFLTVNEVHDKDAVSSAVAAVEMMCYYASRGITLQQLKKQKKSGRPAGESTYILPIEKLDQLVKEAFKAGSVPKLKVTLSCPLGLMPGSLTLKTVIQEGSLVSGKKTLDNFRDETYPLSDAHMALAERLGDLFSPARSGGRYFGFLALGQAKNKKDCFRVYLSTSLPGAVDNTYSSITELIEACHHDRKRYGKLLKEAEAIKARLDKLEGLDEH